jgi:hypothetical protein
MSVTNDQISFIAHFYTTASTALVRSGFTSVVVVFWFLFVLLFQVVFSAGLFGGGC